MLVRANDQDIIEPFDLPIRGPQENIDEFIKLAEQIEPSAILDLAVQTVGATDTRRLIG